MRRTSTLVVVLEALTDRFRRLGLEDAVPGRTNGRDTSRVQRIGVGLGQGREHRATESSSIDGLRARLGVDLVLEVGQAPLELRPQ